jgi:hypothetical protein
LGAMFKSCPHGRIAPWARRSSIAFPILLYASQASAETILERVLRASRGIEFGLILANLAETWRPPAMVPGFDTGPAIDGSITFRALGGLRPPDSGLISAAASQATVEVMDMTSMAIAAINGGQTVTGYALSVGVLVDPGTLPPFPSTGTTQDLAWAGSLAGLGQNALGIAAMTDDVWANLQSHLMPGTIVDNSTVLILNAASSQDDLSAQISTYLSGVDARLRDASATAIGAVNTGDVVAGITALTDAIVHDLTGQ